MYNPLSQMDSLIQSSAGWPQAGSSHPSGHLMTLNQFDPDLETLSSRINRSRSKEADNKKSTREGNQNIKASVAALQSNPNSKNRVSKRKERDEVNEKGHLQNKRQKCNELRDNFRVLDQHRILPCDNQSSRINNSRRNKEADDKKNRRERKQNNKASVDSLLKSNWTEGKDRNGKTYFYNHIKKEYCWEKPDVLQSHAKKSNWTEETASDGKTFYFNHVTKQSVWEKPDELKLQSEKCYWTEEKDENGKTYFLNRRTKYFSWEKPDGLKSHQDTKCVYLRHHEKKIENLRESGSDLKRLESSSVQKKSNWTREKTPTGRIFFFNQVTKQSVWEKPKELKSEKKKSYWTQEKTPSGIIFFFNHITKQSVWEKPEELKSKNEKPFFYNTREIETQKEVNYQALAAVDDLDLVSNAESFECPVCMKYVACGEGVVLHDCLHSFCKDCLAAQIEHSDKARIRCPFQNVEYICESYLQDREIKSLVTHEIYQIHLQRSVGFHCKTPHCTGRCLFKDYMNDFLCPVCKKNNCLTCAAIHEGMTCKEYQNPVALNNNNNEKKTKGNLQDSEGSNFVDKAANHTILAALDERNLVLNPEAFECPICFTDIDGGVGVILHDCLHSFCKECLAGVVQHSETALVRCPFQNDDYACESHLQEREIKSLVTSEMYEKHLQRSVMLAESQAQDSFHCKTPDCPGWCLYEEDVNIFNCPVCSKRNCLTCAAIHEGRNCKQYQDYVAFNCDSNEEAKRTKNYLQTMLKKGEAMECPKCRIIIMKKNGCDALMCLMCRIEICWVTKGPRWGPKGRGDDTGGCKCNYMGKRCHPKCKGCH